MEFYLYDANDYYVVTTPIEENESIFSKNDWNFFGDIENVKKFVNEEVSSSKHGKEIKRLPNHRLAHIVKHFKFDYDNAYEFEDGIYTEFIKVENMDGQFEIELEIWEDGDHSHDNHYFNNSDEMLKWFNKNHYGYSNGYWTVCNDKTRVIGVSQTLVSHDYYNILDQMK